MGYIFFYDSFDVFIYLDFLFVDNDFVLESGYKW